MKTVCRMKFMMLLVMIFMSLMSMEKVQKSNGVKFEGDIVIPYHTLALIGAAPFHYRKYKINFDSGITVPKFPKVSAQTLALVNKAMNIEMNQFIDSDKKVSLFADYYYSRLRDAEKDDLINASGSLHIPLLTAQLMKVCFPADIYQKIAGYFDKERSNISNFFKSQLINSKLLLFNSERFKIDWFEDDPLCGEIDHRSIWMSYDYVTSYQNDPILLYVNDKQYDTYATYFATETYEYRITNKKDNTCILWVIDHDNLENLNYTFPISIKHQKSVKGSCFARMETGQDCIVIFSESDITITKINREIDKNSVPIVAVIHKELRNDYEVVDVCINSIENHLIIGAYEKRNSVVDLWSMDGNFLKKVKSFSFERFGLLIRIFYDYEHLNLLFHVSYNYIISRYRFVQNQYDHVINEYCKIHSVNRMVQGWGFHVYENNDSLLICDRTYFWSIKEDNLNVFRYIYSPDGKYLLCNCFKKKWVDFYIETILRDSITHEILYCADSFLGQLIPSLFPYRSVGFSRDGKNLIFLDENYNSSVSNRVILPNDNDNTLLKKLEEMMSSNIAITLLFKRLCADVKKYKTLDLNVQDPTRKMLIKLAQESSEMLNFLKTCLPLAPIKKENNYNFANLSKFLFGPAKSNLSSSLIT